MTRCIATPKRLAWALVLAGVPAKAARGIAASHDWTMRDAEIVAREADVPLAALYLPDPSRLEMARARLRGRRTDAPLWLRRWAASA